jgi:hypothetical protein
VTSYGIDRTTCREREGREGESEREERQWTWSEEQGREGKMRKKLRKRHFMTALDN